jgi:nucleotide-binding universal stress UspA family protein
MYNRILVPLDGSPLAEQALPHAIAQAERFGAEMILLRAVEPFVHFTGMSLGDLDRIQQLINTWAEQYLERVAADVRERGIQVEIKVIHGSAPVSITQFAESNRADLVVMATGGRSGISRRMMGSVADRVVRGAIVPVLVVQTRGE